jgi:adenine-specific DNA-methyltransferase
VLNEAVGKKKIREYIYFMETRMQIDVSNIEEPYYLGFHMNTAFYFVYEPNVVTTLNKDFFSEIKTKTDNYVIYADLCTLSDKELEKYHITFKKIPRDISKL